MVMDSACIFTNAGFEELRRAKASTTSEGVMINTIFRDLIGLARVPDSDRHDWLNGAQESAFYLRENFKSGEILIYVIPTAPRFDSRGFPRAA